MSQKLGTLKVLKRGLKKKREADALLVAAAGLFVSDSGFALRSPRSALAGLWVSARRTFSPLCPPFAPSRTCPQRLAHNGCRCPGLGGRTSLRNAAGKGCGRCGAAPSCRRGDAACPAWTCSWCPCSRCPLCFSRIVSPAQSSSNFSLARDAVFCIVFKMALNREPSGGIEAHNEEKAHGVRKRQPRGFDGLVGPSLDSSKQQLQLHSAPKGLAGPVTLARVCESLC